MQVSIVCWYDKVVSRSTNRQICDLKPGTLFRWGNKITNKVDDYWYTLIRISQHPQMKNAFFMQVLRPNGQIEIFQKSSFVNVEIML